MLARRSLARPPVSSPEAATGQEVSFFAFRSIDGKVAYKDT